ncbi:hypothetical protein BT96DRAFT_283577 [Gymnopus androsaceus JB14]|uniref:3'-5' exonuclease domain-containing protein n=1 Tax=Gymnopus androsaceus JB14 TaxID=1447944 RepID=A0A6A4I2U6_9AGAR|nr:hypothetical protein BT96DRAFT_283577 [Gymnopus androsaceus JB14]
MDQNFLFDILALPNSSLQPLFDILTNPDIRKILYDGRMDFCALYHGFGVKLVNVIDLQLADVKSRHVRGETHEKQSQRQRRCFSFKQINDPRNAYKYDDVHVLQGLGPCLVDHQCMSTSPKKHVDHETWKERPLSPQHLQYAAHDVVLIDILHSCFLQDGYIDSELPSQSQLYVSLWSDAPPHPDDIFRSHPLLPLDILKTNPSSPKLTCPGCARLLSLPCFPVRVKQSIPAHLANHCWVCLAVPQWLYMMRVRKEQRERQKAIRENENMRRGEATAALFGGYSGSYTSPGRSTFVPASPSNHSSSGLESPLSSPMPNGRGRGQSPRATWQPSRGTGQSLRGTGQPSRGTGQPSRGTGQPLEVQGNPFEVQGNPLEVQSNLLEAEAIVGNPRK